jgi:hypothetical protein
LIVKKIQNAGLSAGKTGVAIVMGVTLAVWFALGSMSFGDPSGPVSWPGSTRPTQGTLVTGGGWGRMTRLTNGNWLCVSTTYPPGENSFLEIYTSSDGAKTWKYVSDVVESGRVLDNGELITLTNGTVLLTMRSLILSNSYHLPVYQSTNNGQTWTYLSNIDSNEGTNIGGLWEPKFYLLQNGLLAAFYSNESHPGYSQMISERISTNNGASWGSEIWAVGQAGGGSLRPGMPQICQMATGNYIMVYEIVGIGNADVYYNISSNGMNWPSTLGTHIPCQHAGPFITALPDGRLLVNSSENQVSFSDDFGATWQKIDPPPWNFGFFLDWGALYLVQSNQVAAWVTTNGLWSAFGTLSPPIVWPRQYAADFSSGMDSNWTRYGGNFAIANDTYLLNDTNTYGKALTGDEFWSDGVLQADVMVSTPGNAGLIFRATNPDCTGPDEGFDYYVGLDTGGFVILGIQSNSWTAFTNTPISITTNSWHHMTVNLQGSNITIYVDTTNKPAISYTDRTFTRGQIGVRAFECNAAFKNVTFSSASTPKLTLRPLSSQFEFSWPQTSHYLLLQCTADMALPWMAVTNMPNLLAGIWTVFVPQTPFANRTFWRVSE